MSINLNLRPMDIKDIDEEYISWFINTDGHLNFYTGSGRVFDKETISNDFKKSLETKQWFHYIIEVDGKKIGNIKIGPVDLKNKTSDLVCFIGDRNHLGKGLATKAIAIANQIAFEKHDIRRLHGGMFSTNKPAIRAYTNAGWVVEAEFKGYYFSDGVSIDRVCVACFNPRYFTEGDF